MGTTFLGHPISFRFSEFYFWCRGTHWGVEEFGRVLICVEKAECLTFLLLKSTRGTCEQFLTFESVDEILRCCHSNETSSTALSYGVSCSVIFIRICLQFWYWPLLQELQVPLYDIVVLKKIRHILKPLTLIVKSKKSLKRKNSCSLIFSNDHTTRQIYWKECFFSQH